MYCAKCGEELNTSWKHCLHCGARIFSAKREESPSEPLKPSDKDYHPLHKDIEKGLKKPWYKERWGMMVIFATLVFSGVVLAATLGSPEETRTTQPPTQSEQQEKEAAVKAAEAERKAEAERRKKQRNKWAQQYCSERKSYWNRSFPLLELKNNSLMVAEGNYKKGSNLTLNDCKKNINALADSGSEANMMKIVKGEGWIGMDKMELIATYGAPNDTNEWSSGISKSEQWIYYKDSYGISAYYIYLEDGVVTSYQDF